MQSKRSSLMEALVNTLIGLVTTLMAAPLIYWICNVEMNASQMSMTTLLFTIISVVRNYVIRRFFNKYKLSAINRLAKLTSKRKQHELE